MSLCPRSSGQERPIFNREAACLNHAEGSSFIPDCNKKCTLSYYVARTEQRGLVRRQRRGRCCSRSTTILRQKMSWECRRMFVCHGGFRVRSSVLERRRFKAKVGWFKSSRPHFLRSSASSGGSRFDSWGPRSWSDSSDGRALWRDDPRGRGFESPSDRF